MPIYYNNEILGDDWQNNATIILGAPLHPLGELDTTTFTLQNLNTNDFNRSIIGINHQLLLDTIIGYIFARNLVMAIKMVRKRPRILSGWLCLISSLSGFSWVICVAMGVLYAALNCRGVMWWLVCGLTISSISNSMIVLQKAYLILFRKRWILIVGIISTLPQVAIFIVTWRVCPVAYHPDRGCTFYYPPYLPWVWMGVEAPSQLMFSSIFSYVAYKQYQMFGSSAWKRLARDGIQTMCSVILCKLICGLIIVFDIFGGLSEMFVLVDWLVSSTILVYHCRGIRNTGSVSNKPRTAHILHISQIATAKDTVYLEYNQMD